MRPSRLRRRRRNARQARSPCCAAYAAAPTVTSTKTIRATRTAVGIAGILDRVRAPVSRHDVAMQLAIVLAGIGLYEAARLALSPDWPLALANAHRVARWERHLDLAWEEPLQRGLLSAP